MWLLLLSVTQYQFHQNQMLNMVFGSKHFICYIWINDRGTGVMQIRLSSCACIILFSVFFQGQVVTIADQDSSHTGPIKLKKTGVYKAS